MSVLDKIKNQELTVLVGENDGYGTHLNNSSKYTNELLELAVVGEKMRWNNVNDKKPKIGQVVDIMSNGTRFIDMEVKQDSDGYFFDSMLEITVCSIEDVTHWMPIPPSPVDEN